jgi:hypothetical protein
MVERFKPRNGHNGHRNGKSNGSNQYTKDLIHRGSVFKPAYIEQAKKACEAGFTDNELAELFGVTFKSINQWKLKHPEFGLALKIGEEPADNRVERKLYEKVNGFWVDTEKLFVLKDEFFDTDGNLVRTSQRIHHEPTRDYYPPDTGAICFWLKNRRPDRWRDKHEIDGTIRNEHIFTFNIFENDLSAGMKTIEGKNPRLERRP